MRSMNRWDNREQTDRIKGEHTNGKTCIHGHGPKWKGLHRHYERRTEGRDKNGLRDRSYGREICMNDSDRNERDCTNARREGSIERREKNHQAEGKGNRNNGITNKIKK